MSISETYRCARSIEAIENYTRTDYSIDKDIDRNSGHDNDQTAFYNEEYFWSETLTDPERYWGVKAIFHRFAISEWVPRVPGLYWTRGAKKLRQLDKEFIEEQSSAWTTFTPQGKSAIVLGGVGTLKFPPDDNGNRLVSLSAGHNASSGIPALIDPEIWEKLKFKEGDVIENFSATWNKMTFSWAERFPSIKGIPKGTLYIKDIENLFISERKTPTQFHPCTVMEYSKKDAMLWDFVYATADTRIKNYRKKISNFFESYKNKKERYGRYLISADINDPLWEADYNSPAELKRAEPGADSEFTILLTRAREEFFNQKSTDEILQLLAENYTHEGLKRISGFIGISEQHWLTRDTTAKSINKLMALCIEREKVEELLDAIARDRSDLIVKGG